MLCKVIIGQEPWLSLAISDWQQLEPTIEINSISLTMGSNFHFDFSRTLDLIPSDCTIFIAWGPDFLNYQRWEIFGEFKKRGFKLPPLISRNSNIGTTSKIQENSWVRSFSQIGDHCNILLNSYIGSYSELGSNITVGRNVWIGSRCNVGSNVNIGDNTYLSNETSIDQSVTIGKHVELQMPSEIHSDVKDKSFHLQASNLKGLIIDHS